MYLLNIEIQKIGKIKKIGYRTTFDKYVQAHPDEVANRKQRHMPKNKK